MLHHYCVSENTTIIDAISAIQNKNNNSRCVIIVDPHMKVKGVFSEGDVLRLIMGNVELYTPLKQVMSPTFFYLQEKNFFEAYKLIKRYNITLIPVIDKDFFLVDVITIFQVMEHLAFVNENKE